MFRFHKPQNVVTLFHRPSSAASSRVLTLLKQVNATAVAGATEDQASDHSKQLKAQEDQVDFKLDITEEPPTSDQVQAIFEYLGADASKVVKGASTVDDAKSIMKKNADAFQRPLILAMLRDLPKDGTA
ncbi:MAG: hypothetical protein M1814_002291 [Vezdaea aestivalis]|nr:MAG: hypothetical protein M1814_002291 [Vezdaea aestivalis]